MCSIEKFYGDIYKLFDNITPLKGDCGKLCDKACCKDSDDEECGMFLFPYEEVIMKNAKFGYIDYSNCEYGKDKTAKIFFCKKPCNRELRPLSCRIFPLTPYIQDNKILLKMNTAAMKMCPLAQQLPVEMLEKDFLIAVKYAINRVLKLKEGYDFIEMLTDIENQYLGLCENFSKKIKKVLTN